MRGRLERVEAELAKARRVIEVQGNVSALLEDLLAPKGATKTDTHEHRAMIEQTVRTGRAARRDPAGVPGAGRRAGDDLPPPHARRRARGASAAPVAGPGAVRARARGGAGAAALGAVRRRSPAQV